MLCLHGLITDCTAHVTDSTSKSINFTLKSSFTNRFHPLTATHLDLLKWLDVKGGEQQQVTPPRQGGLSQLCHWEGQTQMHQQHSHTFNPQHAAGCYEAVYRDRWHPELLEKQE